MRKNYSVFLLLLAPTAIFAQPGLDKLTVEKIMRDPKWIGASPSNPQWSSDGQYLFFNWNPTQALADSVYYITLANKTPVRATPEFAQQLTGTGTLVYNKARTAYVFTRENDIFLTELK